MAVKYYAIEPKTLTSNQKIIVKGQFGLYRNILKTFKELTFHELARHVLNYKESHNEFMVKESELGFALLRLVEEGLVGMKGSNVCKNKCCSLDNVNIEFEGFF